MKNKLFLGVAGLVALLTVAAAPKVEQRGARATAAEPPTPATSAVMQPEYAKAIARLAYVWGWPMVNMANRRAAIMTATQPALVNGVLPVAPLGQLAMLHDYINPGETFATCPNQDVVYGLGYFSLDEQPVVLQVPDFGDRFWVYALYDQRTEEFSQLGKQYGTKPGFYLVVGPRWKGDKPVGVEGVIRSPTALASVIPKVFMDDTPEDRVAIQPLINQVAAYPLKEFDGKIRTNDWSKLAPIPVAKSAGGGERQWVVPEKFFDQLGAVLDELPPLLGEAAMYQQFRSILDAAAKDPAIKKALVDTAVQTDHDVVEPLLQWKYNGRQAGNGWNRSVNGARFGTDFYDRLATAKSNIFENQPNETQYFYTDDDSSGAPLDGNSTYEITFPPGEQPPVNGFWSLTLYNEQHLFNPNRLERYSLGTKNTTLERNEDGSLTLYAGARSPGPGKEVNWLPAPRGHFSLFMRAYGGKQPILDGSWTPPPVVKKLTR
jgi:hypothetical protein